MPYRKKYIYIYIFINNKIYLINKEKKKKIFFKYKIKYIIYNINNKNNKKNN